MDPNKTDRREMHRQLPGRMHPDMMRREDSSGQSTGAVVGLIVALVLTMLVVVAGGMVFLSFAHRLDEALENEGVAIIALGFLLITLVAVVKLVTRRN